MTWLDPPAGLPPISPVGAPAFVDAVREVCDRVGAPGLDRECADWVLLDQLGDGALIVVLPLTSSPHASIQLQMTTTTILGTWDDKHYLWDNAAEGEEPFRVQGTDEYAQADALAWLDQQLRRPYFRRDRSWGPFTRTTWEHIDGNNPNWIDTTGFLPFQPRSTHTTQTPAGYLDPVPPQTRAEPTHPDITNPDISDPGLNRTGRLRLQWLDDQGRRVQVAWQPGPDQPWTQETLPRHKLARYLAKISDDHRDWYDLEQHARAARREWGHHGGFAEWTHKNGERRLPGPLLQAVPD